MKRYQKLICDAVSGGDPNNPASRNSHKTTGYNIIARDIGVPTSSLHEWATYPHKVPAYKSLEKLAGYFNVPLPTLLIEVADARSAEDDIVEALFHLDDEQKQQVAEYIKTLESTKKEGEET